MLNLVDARALKTALGPRSNRMKSPDGLAAHLLRKPHLALYLAEKGAKVLPGPGGQRPFVVFLGDNDVVEMTRDLKPALLAVGSVAYTERLLHAGLECP